MKNIFSIFVVLILWFAQSQAAGLLSNFTYDVRPGSQQGELWILCRGDADTSNGWTLYKNNQFSQVILPQDWVGVHDNIFLELTGEYRRTVGLTTGEWQVAQGFVEDSANGFTVPGALLVASRDTVFLESVLAGGLDSITAYAFRKPVEVAAHALQLEKGGNVWLARGPWGITRSVLPVSQWLQGEAFPDSATVWGLDRQASRMRPLDSLEENDSLAIWSLAIDTVQNRVWLGSSKGLWRGTSPLSPLQLVDLGKEDTLPITGVWASPSGFTIVVESSRLGTGSEERTISQLWRSTNGGASFDALHFPYDSLELSISSVAFVGADAWLAVQGIGNNHVGLLKIGAKGPEVWSDTSSHPWLWGMEAGVLDRNVVVTAIASFPLDGGIGLAASTNGAGVTISADSGRTWIQVLNQKAVRGGLAEVRVIPSVMRFLGTESLVAYRLDQNAKVTIDVFSYDMRKVRTIVSRAPRKADAIRSSVAGQDFWDGRDDAGNSVALGMYYVRVKDDKGHETFGKVLWLGAPR